MIMLMASTQTDIKEPIGQNLVKLCRMIICISILISFFVLAKIAPNTSIKPIPKLFQNKQIRVAPNSSADVFYPNIAVLVEFRSTSRIITTVHNVYDHIPSSWPIQIFHGKDNEQFIRNSTLAPLIKTGRIFLTLMKEVYAKNQTNKLLTTPAFWKRVRGEKILLFQIDSAMCSNPRHNLTDFLQYDYIGAPWDLSWFKFNKTYDVGNGGFSLRSRSKILELLAFIPYDRKTPEDVWYAQNMHRVNGSIPPAEIAKAFAVESLYYDRPIGVHRLGWIPRFQDELTKTCPEVKLIRQP